MRKASNIGGWRCTVKAKAADERHWTKRRQRDLRALRVRLTEQLTNLQKENP